MQFKVNFSDLCAKHPKIFSSNTEDFRHIHIVTMYINTGDSPPVLQRPYKLPLKHPAWVKKELEILEKIGIMV